ncbi:MAG TPA: hypothetical protein VGQ46_13640 [Thermoanaerobaculia bacterium]|jgi:hypothetical protein|nr:hypothetical protein [Thermoanaerobaculia bacterium]
MSSTLRIAAGPRVGREAPQQCGHAGNMRRGAPAERDDLVNWTGKSKVTASRRPPICHNNLMELDQGLIAAVIMATQLKAAPLTNGVDPYVKDIVEMVSWGFAILAATFTGLRAVSEMRHNREQRDRALAIDVEDRAQRDRDLRWRKAQTGNELLQHMLDDPLAAAAMQILDWSGRTYALNGHPSVIVVEEDLPGALRPARSAFTPKQTFIRDAFDALFFHFARLNRAIDVNLVEMNDVSMPTSYYIAEMGKRKTVMQDYLRAFHPIALGLVERFPEWTALRSTTAVSDVQRQYETSLPST